MASKKRGNNEGSIFKRKTCPNCEKVATGEEKNLKTCKHCGSKMPDGSWMGQVSIGYDPLTGKPKRKSFYGQTRQEVNAKITKALQEVQNGVYIEPTTITLGGWLDKWLTTYKKGQIKPITYEGYEKLIRVHIQPSLGKIPMAKLQANILQSFYNEKLEHGRADGKGALSTRMVRYFHAIIRQALAQAVKEGILNRNVADATSPPVIKNKQMQPLSEDELLSFLEAAKNERLFAAYLLAATTGLRRGELLGLCWDCVDLEGGAIAVKRQLIPLKCGVVLQEDTKSKSGRRNIALTDDAIRELKAHKRRQAQEKLAMGEAYQNLNLCFCKEDGTYLRPENFVKGFQKRLTEAGLPEVRLHDLRHGHATLLLQRGIPAKMVQERLGHSSITITLDLYSHVTPEMAKAAAASLNGLMAKAADKKKGPANSQGE